MPKITKGEYADEDYIDDSDSSSVLEEAEDPIASYDSGLSTAEKNSYFYQRYYNEDGSYYCDVGQDDVVVTYHISNSFPHIIKSLDGSTWYLNDDGSYLYNLSPGEVVEEFHENGQPKIIVDTDGNKNVYTENGVLSKKIYADGTICSYDENINITSIRNADRSETKYIPNGNRKTEIDVKGNREYYAQDGIRLLRSYYPSKQREVVYYSNGLPRAVRGKNGTVRVYSNSGRLLRTNFPHGTYERHSPSNKKGEGLQKMMCGILRKMKR